jgi:hypothetical protein
MKTQKDVQKIHYKNQPESKIIQKQNSSNKLINFKHLSQQN